MRLLHTKTLELHEFFGDEIPPYAILSHTWGEGEVSFQELRSSSGNNKAGYDKIRGCCEMAVSDGFQYAWVDTCCIDKTSSAELSEAINSMYNWYRHSDVCYVYLPDVAANLGTKATEDAIRKSRWFTRGWTLQELIAPSGVIFFDSKWGDLGTKESLETVITDITKIKGEVLRDANNMGEFSVAQKMSWASERVTTRVEDIAYCLLGIFGVNMPMLYGEGDQAFIRLQEEIMKSELDHSIFAWTGTSYFSPGLLAPAPACFTNSGNIVQFENQAASPFTSANKGIHLHLPLKAIDRSAVHLAVLDCYEIIGTDEKRLLGIYIERRYERSSIFRRIRGRELGNMNRAEVHKLKQENIFVKQERMKLEAPSCQTCWLSVHGLKKIGSEIELQYSVPDGWYCFGNGFISASDDFNQEYKYSAFHFWEINSLQRFFLILREKRRGNEWGQWTEKSLRVSIVEHIPDCTEISTTWSNLSEKGKLFLFLSSINRANSEIEKVWLGSFVERLYWQHPVGKWWISVIVKKGIVSEQRPDIAFIKNGIMSDQRAYIAYISWHTPKAD